MEWKADFAAMSAYEKKRWARADRGKAFVGQLRRRILKPANADDSGREAHDRRYKPADALRERIAEADIEPGDRLDGQCRVRFTKYRETVKEDAHEHPNGTRVSEELSNMRNVGVVDDAFERRVRMYFEAMDESDTNWVTARRLSESLAEFGCTVEQGDMEKLCEHEIKKQAMSVDDIIILVARTPVLGEAMAEAGLHERSAAFVEEVEVDAFAAYVRRTTGADVEAAERDARAWLWAWVEAAAGDYAWDEDEAAVAAANAARITEGTNERLHAVIRKRCGAGAKANRFEAVADEMNLEHILRPKKAVFDWKEELKFTFCCDVDAYADLTAEDYQRMVDIRETAAYRDPEREYRKISVLPEDYSLRIDPLGRHA